MKNETARFITAYKRDLEPGWLSLLGTSGAGKTMLAKEVRRICGGRFIEWVKVCKMLREGEYRWFDDLTREELLLVDDVGSEYQTGFIAAKLYELLSQRVGKWTVWTANLSLREIGAIDARISSRMLRGENVVVEVDVTDWNLR